MQTTEPQKQPLLEKEALCLISDPKFAKCSPVQQLDHTPLAKLWNQKQMKNVLKTASNHVSSSQDRKAPLGISSQSDFQLLHSQGPGTQPGTLAGPGWGPWPWCPGPTASSLGKKGQVTVHQAPLGSVLQGLGLWAAQHSQELYRKKDSRVKRVTQALPSRTSLSPKTDLSDSPGGDELQPFSRSLD